jgi:hypothetical protein
MAKTYEPITTTTISSNTATITLSSIPATYTDLIMITTAKSDQESDIYVRFNGDTATNYSYIYGSGNHNGNTAHAGVSINGDWGHLADAYGLPGTDNRHTHIFNVFNYANTNVAKSVLTTSFRKGDGVDYISTCWRNTAAVNSITLRFVSGAVFQAGTIVSLYGILKA